MKIKINNVAKVLEAEISCNGITVITGLNNTGKSTILKSFYATENIFRNTNIKVADERRKSIQTIIRRCESYFDEKGYEKVPRNLLEDFCYALHSNLNKFVENPTDFSYFKEIFEECLMPYAEFIEDDFIYSDKFLKPIFNKVKSVFGRKKEEYMKYIGDMYIRNTFANQVNNIQDISEASISIKLENDEHFISIRDNKIEQISYGFIDNDKPDIIYLPAYNMLDYISTSGGYLYENVYSAERQVLSNLYDQPVRNESYEEYLEIEDNINVIKEILHEVIQGNLKLSLGKLVFEDGELDTPISIKNVASGIKNFLIIQSLVERGKLKRNSILLIDEPETNLHPEWHIIFAEILVLMYKNMGVISIVNSHSPYFIRALEVKMADHGIKNKGAYYLMEKAETNGYIAKNVTNDTEKIYKKLYRPLEYL